MSVMPDKINYYNNNIHCTTEMLMHLMLLYIAVSVSLPDFLLGELQGPFF